MTSHILKATFTQVQYTLTTSVVGGGNIIVYPDQASYFYGDIVTLTAVPTSGWQFAGWSGGASGTSNPLTLTITSNTTVTATFTQILYTVTVSVVGEGSVTKNPDLPGYVAGTNVLVTAIPAIGWKFSGWELDGVNVGSENPLTIIV